MTRHVITDDDWNVVAAYCGQELDEAGQAAMRNVVAAALRHHAAQDPDGGLGRRQAEKIAAVRERVRRLRAAAAHRQATMPDYPDPPMTDDERAERDAMIRMQSWPDGDDH